MRQFSVEHLAALGVLVVAAVGSVWLARRGRATLALSVTLAIVVLAGWVGEQVADVVDRVWSVKYTLPLQLTDVVSVVAIVALLRPTPLLVELTYFWALTASLQATLTPDLAQPFPDVRYFTYFLTHGGALVAVVVLRALPRPGGMWRAYTATVAWAALAAAGDLITGGNYMFLRRKPAHGSLLDVMGPWPLYILAAAAFGLVLLLALAWLASTSASGAAAPEGGGGRRDGG